MTVRLAEVSVNVLASGQLCTNVTHWSADAAETNLWLLAKDIVDAFEAGSNAEFSGLMYGEIMSADAFVSSISARIILPTPGTKAIRVFETTDYPGQLSSDIYAQSVAGVIKLVTASGPDKTGRMFIPAVPEDAIENGRFTDAYRTAMNATMSALDAGIDATETWLQQVLTRSTGSYEPVTNRQFNPNPGTIRKRLLPV